MLNGLTKRKMDAYMGSNQWLNQGESNSKSNKVS